MRGGISRRPGPLGTIQTLPATCRLQGVNPYDDLVDVLQRVGDHPAREFVDVLQRVGDHPAREFVDLPPRSWKGKFAGATLKSDVSSRGKSSGFERLRRAGAPQPLK